MKTSQTIQKRCLSHDKMVKSIYTTWLYLGLLGYSSTVFSNEIKHDIETTLANSILESSILKSPLENPISVNPMAANPISHYLTPTFAECNFEIKMQSGQAIKGKFLDFKGEIIPVENGLQKVKIEIFSNQAEISNNPLYTRWMKGKEFFSVEKYPLITFESEAYSPHLLSKGGNLTGSLTLRGIQHTEELQIKPNYCEKTRKICGFIVEADVLRSKYGMNNLEWVLQDNVLFTLRTELPSELIP